MVGGPWVFPAALQRGFPRLSFAQPPAYESAQLYAYVSMIAMRLRALLTARVMT